MSVVLVMVTNLCTEIFYYWMAGGGLGHHPCSECRGSPNCGPRYLAEAVGADQSPGEEKRAAA